MSIQGSINKLLTVAAVGSKMLPSVEAAQAERAIGQDITAGQNRLSILSAQKGTKSSAPLLEQLRAETSRGIAASYKKQWELNPSEETLGQYMTAEKEAGKYMSIVERRKKKAEEALKARQEELRLSKKAEKEAADERRKQEKKEARKAEKEAEDKAKEEAEKNKKLEDIRNLILSGGRQ